MIVNEVLHFSSPAKVSVCGVNGHDREATVS